MGRRTVEILTCDVCGREVKENEWTHLSYPTLVHYLDDWSPKVYKNIRMLGLDVCDSCLDKMTELSKTREERLVRLIHDMYGQLRREDKPYRVYGLREKLDEYGRRMEALGIEASA